MAPKCGKCNRSINTRTENYITCANTCKSHYRLICAGITDDAFDKLKDSNKIETWTCGFCSLKLSDVNIANTSKSTALFRILS